MRLMASYHAKLQYAAMSSAVCGGNNADVHYVGVRKMELVASLGP